MLVVYAGWYFIIFSLLKSKLTYPLFFLSFLSLLSHTQSQLPLVGNPAPDFEAEAVFDQEFIKVNVTYLNLWSILLPMYLQTQELDMLFNYKLSFFVFIGNSKEKKKSS